MQSYNEKAGEKVAFLQIKNYCIETFENGKAEMSDGAYQHVALDVEDIEIQLRKYHRASQTIAQISTEKCTPAQLKQMYYMQILLAAEAGDTDAWNRS